MVMLPLSQELVIVAFSQRASHADALEWLIYAADTRPPTLMHIPARMLETLLLAPAVLPPHTVTG